ncbi:MAG: hypothetical protein ABIZ70_15100 [Gemmatimonadales bacterium]
MLSTGTTLSARAQTLIPALVTILVVAALSPIGDVILPRMPLQLSEVQPRFQIFGLLLAAGPQVAMLLAVIAAIALFGGYRIGVRIAAIFALVMAVVYVPLVMLFALDFLQVRRQVNQEMIKGFDIAAMKTGATGFLLALLLAWAGWLALKASVKDETTGRKQKGDGLIVGQE